MQAQAAKDARESQHTILLVEDFDDTRLMMKLWLAKNGYHVIEAANGPEAIESAASELPDLIIMDLMMPGMDGLAATRRIREHEALRETPIVVVSAYGADEYRAQALEAGCNEYVATPFEPSELESLIRNLLARDESETANSSPAHPRFEE
jgi:CheY-like chemotaxis protein